MLEHLINLFKKIVDNTHSSKSVNKKVVSNPSKKTNISRAKKATIPVVINNTARVQNLLAKMDAFANGTPPFNWSPSRFIYKIGGLQLKGIVSQLVKIATQETDLLSQDTFRYSMIWTLGRCGDASILPLLDKMVKNDEKEYIKRLTLDVYLTLAPAAAKNDFVNALTTLLPPEALTIIQKGNFSNLSPDQITILFSPKASKEIPPLFCAYLLSFQRLELRTSIIALLKNIPLQYPYFQSIRYIFKSAEFRNDFEILGLLAYRLDSKNASYKSTYTWKWNKQTNKYSRQVRRIKNSAFSNRTKTYFQKKIIRSLVLMGEQKMESYCNYATALLKEYRDVEIVPKVEIRHDYARENGQYFRIQYNSYALLQTCGIWLMLNVEQEVVKRLFPGQICHIKDPLYQQLYEDRTEPFAELWNTYPQYALQLLMTCASDFVANFALKIIKTQPNESNLITKEVIIDLLQNPLNKVADYALIHIERFFEPTNPDWAILSTFIQTPNENVRNYFFNTIEQHPIIYFNHTQLIEGAALSLQTEIANWFQEKASQLKLDEIKKTILFELLLAKIQTILKEENAQLLFKNSQAFFTSQIVQTSITKSKPLLAHPLENVQLLGAAILIAQKEKITEIPEATILKMMEAPFLSIRVIGMELFGEMPIENLLEKKDILVSMAISKEPEMRAAIQPILAKTAEGKPEWARQLLQFFVPILLQKETYEGLHADTLELLVNYLGDQLKYLPNGMCWKLIQSQYREANLLGMELLQYQDFSKVSLFDIISFGNHEMPTIRQYCFDYFNENIGRIRYESEEALGLLDAKWEDSRQFGFAFFEKHFKGGDWTPALLVSICDSTRPDVQEFGKKMLVKFFDEGKGEAYLMQLSQHPNVSLQLFATSYLRDYAAGNTPNFIRLKPYFKTILCQLFKGSATKKEIFNFLESEALKNQEIAEHAVEILNKVSLTMAIRDKARCIQLLHKIRKSFPELESVLEIQSI